jgi:hypothetical protein
VAIPAREEEAVDHPKPWLRYIDAAKIADRTLELDGMKVRNTAGDQLGEVDGLIVDSDSGRTYYIVVDGPGWFSSKQFLLPIGQTHLGDDRDALVVNLTKAQVKRFPGFDKDEFDSLSEADIKRINDEIGVILEPTASYPADEPFYEAWQRRTYQYPEWWTIEPWLPNRTAGTAFERVAEYPSSQAKPLRRERSPQRLERSEAHETSPHFDERAQPGDVLGVETEGERTYIGDTKEDEETRREKALEEDAKTKKRS